MTTAPNKTVATPKPAVKPVKAVAKPVVKTAATSAKKVETTPAKPTAQPAAKVSAKPVPKAAAVKPEKVKKPKLVRDSFTIPKAEYGVIDALKQRAAKLAQPVKKSELLRAGIKALAALSDAALKAALQAVPAIKTGRPKN